MLSLSYSCDSGSFQRFSFRNVTKSQPDLNFVFPLQINQPYSRQKNVQYYLEGEVERKSWEVSQNLIMSIGQMLF